MVSSYKYSVIFKRFSLDSFLLSLLRSCGVRRSLLCVFDQGIGGLMAEDRNRINKLIKEAGCIIGVTSHSQEGITEQRNTWKFIFKCMKCIQK